MNWKLSRKESRWKSGINDCKPLWGGGREGVGWRDRTDVQKVWSMKWKLWGCYWNEKVYNMTVGKSGGDDRRKKLGDWKPSVLEGTSGVS